MCDYSEIVLVISLNYKFRINFGEYLGYCSNKKNLRFKKTILATFSKWDINKGAFHSEFSNMSLHECLFMMYCFLFLFF